MAVESESLELLTPICEFCGRPIEGRDECPALSEGVCRP